MSEIAEAYDAMHMQSKKKKERNRNYAEKQLLQHGIEFDIKNRGYHFIVYGIDEVIDYWPSTGKFIGRNVNGCSGRGIQHLLRKCGVKDGSK